MNLWKSISMAWRRFWWKSTTDKSSYYYTGKHFRLWKYRPYASTRWQGVYKLEYRTGQHPYYGAGYIGGWTFFVAIRCHDPRNYHARRFHFIQVGMTDNANRIPNA